MPYFVRAYREYLAAGATGSILLFPNVWPAQTRSNTRWSRPSRLQPWAGARLPEGKLDPLLAGLRLEALRRPHAKQRQANFHGRVARGRGASSSRDHTPFTRREPPTGDFNEAQGIPVPRLLFNLYMMAQRPLHCPAPTHGAEGAPTPPISASRPGFAAAVSLLGWLHGTR